MLADSPIYGYTQDTRMYAAQLNAAALSQLEPNTASLAKELIIRAYVDHGIQIVIYDTLRSYARQHELYSKGRTTPGDIVTNAKPGYSWHNFGRAFDYYIMLPDRQPSWNNIHYPKIGEIGKSLGLKWGGLFNDPGHFEYTSGATLSSLRAQKPGWENYTYSEPTISNNLKRYAVPVGALLLILVVSYISES